MREILSNRQKLARNCNRLLADLKAILNGRPSKILVAQDVSKISTNLLELVSKQLWGVSNLAW